VQGGYQGDGPEVKPFVLGQCTLWGTHHAHTGGQASTVSVGVQLQDCAECAQGPHTGGQAASRSLNHSSDKCLANEPYKREFEGHRSMTCWVPLMGPSFGSMLAARQHDLSPPTVGSACGDCENRLALAPQMSPGKIFRGALVACKAAERQAHHYRVPARDFVGYVPLMPSWQVRVDVYHLVLSKERFNEFLLGGDRMGSRGRGLTHAWREECDAHEQRPQAGPGCGPLIARAAAALRSNPRSHDICLTQYLVAPVRRGGRRRDGTACGNVRSDLHPSSLEVCSRVRQEPSANEFNTLLRDVCVFVRLIPIK
jgi:hypothetical protein